MKIEIAGSAFQWGMVGQRASLRQVNPDNADDVNRMIIAEQWEKARMCIGSPITTEIGMYSYIRNLQKCQSTALFAVSGNNANQESERLRIQGWIQLTSEDCVQTVAQLNLGDSYVSAPPPIEVSYLRCPKADRHQMASALRQLCAYVQYCDFSTANKSQPRRNILARVLRENIDSTRVLEAAGFVWRSNSVTINKGKVTPYLLYLLDWDILDGLLCPRQSTDDELLRIAGISKNEQIERTSRLQVSKAGPN